MDPVTHGVIGLAISAFSGDPVTLMNPISIGCALGAMAPDIDVVVRIFKDDFHYLKHHRGFSHSLPALGVIALAISAGLQLIFPEANFLRVLLWTFIGAMSHTFFDILNSYGAKIMAPFTDKKLKASLLMLYDPIVTILALILIFKRSITWPFLSTITIAFLVYIGLRFVMRKYAYTKLLDHYSDGYKMMGITILPSLIAFYKWDFIVETNSHNIVGQFNIINSKIFVRRKFKKHSKEYVRIFNDTNVGKYFNDFSDNLHVVPIKNESDTILKCIDLRYFYRGNFMHHATVVLDKNLDIKESYFHPYDTKKYIPVFEK